MASRPVPALFFIYLNERRMHCALRICIPASLCCSLMADECSCVRKRFVKSFSVAHEYFLGFIFSLLLLLSVILAASNVGHLSTTHPLFSVTFMAESEAGVFTLPPAKGNLQTRSGSEDHCSPNCAQIPPTSTAAWTLREPLILPCIQHLALPCTT